MSTAFIEQNLEQFNNFGLLSRGSIQSDMEFFFNSKIVLYHFKNFRHRSVLEKGPQPNEVSVIEDVFMREVSVGREPTTLKLSSLDFFL